ncbi:uroplakin-2-like [Ambystoma mexicanum]|uniref:uroplakin-2-like n=1 Tax=Ambystoma mexicanum TaxID=8296 RepID=UPI0037E7B112
MKVPCLLLCVATVIMGLASAVPFSSLSKLPAFSFFGNQDNIIGNRMGYSFITNIPSCISGAGYTPASILLAVSTSAAVPGVSNTDAIKSLLNDSRAQVYYAGQFNTVPCRVSRDVVQVSSKAADNSFTLTTVLGYQVGSEVCTSVKGLYCNQVLEPGTPYRVNFFILDASNVIRAYTDWSDIVTTLNVTNNAQLDSGLSRRSGGMVVITVLLSIALFMLVPALIATLVVGREKSPLP